MVILLCVGLFLLLMGIMLLVAPQKMAELNGFLNRSVFSDSGVYAHSRVMAVVCLLAAALILGVYYYHG